MQLVHCKAQHVWDECRLHKACHPVECKVLHSSRRSICNLVGQAQHGQSCTMKPPGTRIIFSRGSLDCTTCEIAGQHVQQHARLPSTDLRVLTQAGSEDTAEMAPSDMHTAALRLHATPNLLRTRSMRQGIKAVVMQAAIAACSVQHKHLQRYSSSGCSNPLT